MIRVVPADTEKLFSQFIAFPHHLYRGDPNYAPQPNLLQRQLLHPQKNPFFRTAEAAYFLALDDRGSVVGRIAAIHNRAHTELYQDDTGFFGCFDCVNNREVASSLLTTSAGWLKARGLRQMIGPENLSTNDSVGILTRGFDSPPVILMPYNYPYYGDLLEGNRLEPVMTLYSYLLQTATFPKEVFLKAQQLESRLQEHGIVIRPISMKRFSEDVSRLRTVYNDANVDGWGFLPLDDEGFQHMAKDLKQLIDAEHVLLVEKDANLIGYAVVVPDYNQVFRKIPDGRLLPFGWYHLLAGRRAIRGIRIMILGVLPAYRRLGIDWCLYARIAANAAKRGVERGEACYVMEKNVAMNRMLHKMQAEIVKEYKLYKMALS